MYTALAGLLLTTISCSRLRALTPTGATLASVDTDAQLSPSLRYRAYTATGDNTADVYLTDLSPEEIATLLDEAGGLAQIRGQILHIHMFLEPRPGRTPIEPTAVNATVRYAVLANGELGVYAGAGFLLPASSPGAGVFAGDVIQTSLRLNRATDRFRDLLGPSELRASFSAGNRPDEARRMASVFTLLAQQTRPVEPPSVIEP